jgi:hypothetical protein
VARGYRGIVMGIFGELSICRHNVVNWVRSHDND